MSQRALRATQPPFVACVRAFEDEFDYVFRTLRRHGVAPVDAEDLAQDVFLVMWRRWSVYDSARPIRPWLAGIAFRLAYHHRGRRARENPGGALDVVGDTPNPEEQLVSERARSLVLAALAGLPEKYRAPVVLCDLDGLPMPEIAAILGVPLATAYTRVRRARQAFAEEVARRRTSVEDARPLVIPAAALLEVERTPPPVPAALRRRVQARVRALQPVPPALVPGTGSPAAVGRGASVPWMPAEIALCAALAVLATLAWWSPPPARAAAWTPAVRPAGADVGVPDRRLRTVERRRPPAFERRALARSASTVPAALSEGMVGYWRFDEERSGNVARDSSGRGNDCILRGLDPARAWMTGVYGGAIDLRGRGWLECKQKWLPTAAPDDVTVAAWVNRHRTTPRYHTVMVTRELTADNRDDYFFGFWGDELKASSSAWGQAASGRFGPPPGRWSHVAFTHRADGTTVLYLDGREIARTSSAPRTLGKGSRRLTIGAGHGSGSPSAGQDFEGALDELLVYDRALSADEIASLAAGAQPQLSL